MMEGALSSFRQLRFKPRRRILFQKYIADHYLTIQQVRLADGATANDGRFEILENGTWGGVCNDSLEEKEAEVLCRMLNSSYR